MRRVLPWLAGLIPVLAAAACTAGGGNATAGISHPGQTYRDSSGWTIEIPPGWYAVRFSDSKDGITSAGVQLSNVQLPPPTLAPDSQSRSMVASCQRAGWADHRHRYRPPPQAWSRGGAALARPGRPDGWKYWNAGSASAGAPYIQTLWFRFKGTAFVACAKIGPWDSPRQSTSYSRPNRLGSYHPQHSGTGQIRNHCTPWEPGGAVVVGAGHGNGE